MAKSKKIAPETISVYNVADMFDTPTDKKLSKKLASQYIKDYQLETISDKNNLRELIRLEVVQNRLHNQLNEFYKDQVAAIPANLLELIHKNGDMIIKVKNTLGLNKDKESKKGYDAFDHLLTRGKKWLSDNQMSRYRECPHCQKKIWMKMRPEVWEAYKHPYFKDNMIYNTFLFEEAFGKTMKVDEDFIAKVLGTSEDFPKWVRQKTQKL